MKPNGRQEPPSVEPSSQGDGSSEPIHIVELPEYGLRVLVTVQRLPATDAGDEADVAEAGYGHGV